MPTQIKNRAWMGNQGQYFDGLTVSCTKIDRISIRPSSTNPIIIEYNKENFRIRLGTDSA